MISIDPLPEPLQPSRDDRVAQYVRILRRIYPTKVFDEMGRELKDRAEPEHRKEIHEGLRNG